MLNKVKSSFPKITKKYWAKTFNFAPIYFKNNYSTANNLTLTVSSPTFTVCDQKAVREVTVPGTDGIFTILANHVPSIAELTPGTVIITDNEGKSENFFISGGFCIVNRDSTCSITTVECVPVDRLDPSLVKKGLDDFERAVSTATSDTQKAEAEIGVLTFKAMSFAVQV